MSADRSHVLIVAYKTAATPALLDAVRERAAAGPARFTLLVPNPVDGLWPGDDQQAWREREGASVLALALPLLEEAAGDHVDGSVSIDPSAFDVVQVAVREGDYDEIIVSTLPHTVSHWLHIDLPASLTHLGLPVTTVVARHQRIAHPEQS